MGKGIEWQKGIQDQKEQTNKFSYAGKVNATLRPCSIFLRVADYFFESAESAFDLGAKTLAAQALAAADLGQSWMMSFLTTVKAKSFLHMVIMFISGELAILAQLVRDGVLRLILRGAFWGFGGWWWWAMIVAWRVGRWFGRGAIGIGGLVRIFLTPRFLLFPELLDSRWDSSSCIQ